MIFSNEIRARRLHALVAALALASFAAPASAQKDRADVLLSDRPAPRHDCRVMDTPRTLPAVAQLADSVGLAQGLATYASKYPLAGDRRMYAVYSIGFDAAGRIERLQPIDYLLPQGYEGDLNELVRSTVHGQRAGNPVSLRLRVEPAAQPVMRVGRSEQCPPQANMRFEVLATGALALQHPSPIRARATVDSTGHVVAMRITQPSGEQYIDAWVEEVLNQHVFTPGLIDGVPWLMEAEESFFIRGR
jgi:hypothetical protein